MFVQGPKESCVDVMLYVFSAQSGSGVVGAGVVVEVVSGGVVLEVVRCGVVLEVVDRRTHALL